MTTERRFRWKAATALIIGIALIAVLFLTWRMTDAIPVSSDQYVAVFLSNNQVYFGKFKDKAGRYPSLVDVYYIRALAPQDLSTVIKSESQLQLVKLGSELHGPEDVMYLNRDDILFIEPLKADSRIVRSIQNIQQKSGF